jgi:hypothetical protein
MNTDYFLSKQKMYNNLIHNFNSIIAEYDELLQIILNNEQNNIDIEISQIKQQQNELIHFLKHIHNLKNICNNYVNTNCIHKFENDSIDITPDLSRNICYCTICGYTLH